MRALSNPATGGEKETIKELILCADDYAQSALISEGIIQLCELKRINAISCMVNAPLWQNHQQHLLPLQQSTFIGLHFNLTQGVALSEGWQNQYGAKFRGLAPLVLECYLDQLNKDVLLDEFRAQLDAFTEATGMLPDFIDGHQHIHQLPIIRDRLLLVYHQQQLSSLLRTTSNGIQDLRPGTGFPKPQALLLLGAIAFKRQLLKRSIPTNTSFAGIYNFKNSANYPHYFKQFLKKSRDKGLIMCHPGLPSADCFDPLVLHRHHEFDYLMSNQFLADLKEHNVRLAHKPARGSECNLQ